MENSQKKYRVLAMRRVQGVLVHAIDRDWCDEALSEEEAMLKADNYNGSCDAVRVTLDGPDGKSGEIIYEVNKPCQPSC